MKQILRGPIYSLTLEYTNCDGKDNLNESSHFLKKDALFYCNNFGQIISFDYGTKLADYDEAYSYLYSLYESFKDKSNIDKYSIAYYNMNELEYLKSVETKELKQLKRTYNKN